jgi:hypothetical protein
MGNYSRNTYDPNKDYTAVRLQQGVPLVDADWNELNDIVRNEAYNSVAMAISDGVQSDDYWGLRVQSVPGDNDFRVLGGFALVNGVRAGCGAIQYKGQRWRDPSIAANEGVAVIPDLTKPFVDRTDLVYLDVSEREVNSKEDTDLLNPAIGVETCARMKRVVTIRVREGSTSLPSAGAGHGFLRLALLHRRANVNAIAAGDIEDVRPVMSGFRGVQEITMPPLFLPYSNQTPWQTGFCAAKPYSTYATGVLPLALPRGARLVSFRVRGIICGPITFTVYRVDAGANAEGIAFETFQPPSNSSYLNLNHEFSPADPAKARVDEAHSYLLHAYAPNSAFAATITNIGIGYQF